MGHDQPTPDPRVDQMGARPLDEATRSTEDLAADGEGSPHKREHNVGLPGLGTRPVDPEGPGRTHGAYGSGRPHFDLLDGDRPTGRRFELRQHHTDIGSRDGVDIRLDGVPAVVTTVVHDEHDEYVLTPPLRQVKVLRTGARIELGPWTLVFRRDEHADHGRPFGGMSGEGEVDGQRTQPPRPDYREEAARARERQRRQDSDDERRSGGHDAAAGVE